MFDYLPLSYTFKSRILTKSERLSWFVIYPLFLFLFVYLFELSFVYFLLYLFSIVSVYEVGYLYNDFVTTKKEKTPTLRAGGWEGAVYNNFHCHVVIRILLSYAIAISIFIFYNDFYLLVVISAILLTYYFHNSLRSRLNVFTYFLLVSERYIGPIVFFKSLPAFFIVLLCFPLCRTIEHSCKKKYNFNFIKNLVKDPDFFRVKYYTFISFLVLGIIFIFDWNIEYLILPVYFLVYRTLAYYLRGFANRNKHDSY